MSFLFNDSNVGCFTTFLADFYRLSKDSEMAEFWTQFLAILPVYVLQFCYGMSGAYPAVTTPQLTMDCALFSITPDQESNIGTKLFFGSLLTFPFSVNRQSHQSLYLYSVWISSAEIRSEDSSYPQLHSLYPRIDWSCVVRAFHKYLVSLHIKV